MAAYLPHIKNAQDSYISIKSSKKNCKSKHEQLVGIVKTAQGEKVNDQLITTTPIDSGECPHCARNFGFKSYDRHVEFCRKKAQRISTAPVISQVAKERLEARTKYRAPPLKSQRTVTKEKYSPKIKTFTQDVSSVPIKVIQPLKTFKNRTPQNRNIVSNIPNQLPTAVKKKDQIIKSSLYGDRNAIHLPQKPDLKNETVMKKSESACVFISQNHIKQGVMVNHFDKKNISKSNHKKYIAIEDMLYGDNEKNLNFDLAEQELLKSVSEFENLLKITDEDNIVPPSLNRTSVISMISGINSKSSADSTYSGSLNRKTEHATTGNCLTLLKAAKFCHECGFKYPIVDIKFCTECGMRRIVT
ncbi:PREDICTED: zinc finger C2HC domain-containing protein 1A-like [Diuraphis noxia]|uniref:zinc finger C2HC domain-containing protein 1A-like n=1 Tax=Diuraphis noxia TaxID=143948 RepID=UPI00076367A2|nr:PREDICTED: zinc finger C2HC domain-containing protein 1A-like [Diuraphis noxia]